MKRIIYIPILCLIFMGSWISANAQPGPDHDGRSMEEKIEAFKVAFFTRKLQLTSAEAKLFWPVYDEYATEVKLLRAETKKKMMAYWQNRDSYSDIETEEVADALISLKQQEIGLIDKYHKGFKEALPIGKVVRLYRVEEEFKQWIIQEIQKRQQQRKENANRSNLNRPGNRGN